jgi:hypothetical protein
MTCDRADPKQTDRDGIHVFHPIGRGGAILFHSEKMHNVAPITSGVGALGTHTGAHRHTHTHFLHAWSARWKTLLSCRHVSHLMVFELPHRFATHLSSSYGCNRKISKIGIVDDYDRTV